MFASHRNWVVKLKELNDVYRDSLHKEHERYHIETESRKKKEGD